MEIVNKSIESGERTYFARQNLIIRQTCIKAASVAFAGLHQAQTGLSTAQVSTRIKDIAEDLYAWVTESDYKLPEPPEEP